MLDSSNRFKYIEHSELGQFAVNLLDPGASEPNPEGNHWKTSPRHWCSSKSGENCNHSGIFRSITIIQLFEEDSYIYEKNQWTIKGSLFVYTWIHGSEFECFIFILWSAVSWITFTKFICNRLAYYVDKIWSLLILRLCRDFILCHAN